MRRQRLGVPSHGGRSLYKKLRNRLTERLSKGLGTLHVGDTARLSR
jgi:hypothetical protein